jgi:hypothetical protein
VARHAMALDERRGPFVRTLWTDEAQRTLPNCDRVSQMWFPGVRSDVGGGYRETGLSDGALAWMIGEASSTVGLRFRPALAALRPDPLGVLHDSGSGLWERLTSSPRAVPPVDRDPAVHRSARRRAQVSSIRQDPYRPTTVLTTAATAFTGPTADAAKRTGPTRLRRKAVPARGRAGSLSSPFRRSTGANYRQLQPRVQPESITLTSRMRAAGLVDAVDRPP